MIKKLITVVILLTFSLVLFACNGGGDESSAATNITMYVYQPEDWAVEYINKVKKYFNDQYKGEIKIDIRFYYGSQFYSNLSTAIENGTCPDIYTISNSNLPAYVLNQYAEPLNSYFTEDEINDIVPQTKSQVVFNDELYAYPWYLEPSTFLYYRKDIVEGQLGFTKDDLMTYKGIYEVCKAMVNNNKVPRAGFPMYIPVGIPRGWATVGMQYNSMNGKYVVSDDWTKSNLNELGLKDLATFYYTIGSNGWCPQQDMTERGYENAIEGLCNDYWLMNFGGSWDISTIMRDYPDMIDKIGIVPVPTSTKERNGYEYTTATNGGWNMVVSSSSSQAKKDAAIKFIRFMFLDSVERAGEFFELAYQSRFAPTNTIQNYLKTIETETPQEWLDVVNTVCQLGISEPQYSWDIINMVNDMLAQSMGCSKGTNFDTEYSKILANGNSIMKSILDRGETNPFLPKE